MFKSHLFRNQGKVDDFLLTYNYNPFPAPPASIDYFENPAKFIIGRDKELEQINAAIRESLRSSESKLMFLQGKQGIGKSTIISSIPNYLREQGLQDKVLIVYFNTSNDPKDFHFLNFYRQGISFLDKTDFLERLVFTTLQKLILLGKTEGGKLEEDLNKLPLSRDYLLKIENDPNYLKLLISEKIPVLQSDIKDYIRKNYRILRSFLKIDNFNFLFTLIDSFIGEDPLAATNALNGSGEYQGFRINTDNLALNTFNDLKKLTRWAHGDSTFLIIFDHLERGLSNPEKVYSSLFSLLIGLRQQPYTCILVSGTLDAFKGLYSVLEEDMKLQLDNWFSFYETLKPLKMNTVVDIVKRHLDNYWANSNFRPPHQYSLYPFGNESVAYLYDNTNEDIRRTLIELYKKVEFFKHKQRVVPVVTFFDALSQLRQEKNLVLKPREINVLADQLLDPQIQDKTRSTTAELAIFELLKIIRKSNIDFTEVKHEPPLGRRKLKPDLYIELFGGLSLKDTKRIAIEVKIYRKTTEVHPKEVKKTHSLIIDKDIDYIHWLTTAPLSAAKYDIPEKFKPHVGRTAPLSKEEMAYLALAIHFKEIFNKKPDAQEADLILKKCGFNLDEIIDSLRKEVVIPSPKLPAIEKPITPEVEMKPLPVIKVTGKKKPIPKHVPTTLPLTRISPPSVLSRAEAINNQISGVITELSGSGKTYVAKSTIIKQFRKQFKIRPLSKEDEERIEDLITEIAKKKQLKVTPTRVYFS